MRANIEYKIKVEIGKYVMILFRGIALKYTDYENEYYRDERGKNWTEER